MRRETSEWSGPVVIFWSTIAYGLTALQLGGRTRASMAPWAVGAACFPLTTEEQMNGYRPPSDTKLVTRPRQTHPTSLSPGFKHRNSQIACVPHKPEPFAIEKQRSAAN